MEQISSPWIDDELSLLQENVARFIERELLPVAPGWETEHRVDADSWRKTAEAGLLGASIPEVYGGGGGTLAHEAPRAKSISPESRRTAPFAPHVSPEGKNPVSMKTVWCGREDSNFHGLSATTTSTLRVYQFRHDRTSDRKPATRHLAGAGP